ncbi:carbamoyl-phosphate synthase (glutamine-hydrolyzing) large subunit [Candidatus Roizmanbacteria bacterium]|nr:carbamoyl-phosphate synthase (glutamine-hydrolyzing) large subunit [Candidatus Roizmanbacteria bacterium]
MKKVLILGSGALKIGEAGEFDYSGSQAIKALKEEKIFTILVNPNIATVQTSADLADKVYFLPVTPYFVEQIIKKEAPDGIFLSFGGQTALNCGVALYKSGVLKKYGVSILGSPISAIILSEDRAKFATHLKKINQPIPPNYPVVSVKEALKKAKLIGYPVMSRAAYTLGGLHSGIAHNDIELKKLVDSALVFAPQVLIEKYLYHYKELEYEIVRDKYDNCLVVCNMENMDPMGIHTGESIVVAPSQTLTNFEFHTLRNASIEIVRSLGIVGECNVQFALNPNPNGEIEYYVIELNARLSRSSALASKATGYPLAYVAAKLALGKGLTEIKNQVTKVTQSCFEPALDYIVTKIPRWDLEKFKGAVEEIGSSMKSVGEVMSIGRSFEESLQKAVRMLDIGVEGPTDNHLFSSKEEVLQFIKKPTPRRIFALAAAFRYDIRVEELYKISGIDPWFLHRIKYIVDLERSVVKDPDFPIQKNLLLILKQAGFSDKKIGSLTKHTELQVRSMRKKFGITPSVFQIDTLAGEVPAATNYLYLTYHGSHHDVLPAGKKGIIVLGSGPYRIGSSVEFDWSCVYTARHLKKYGKTSIVLNCNPETVSTDYDMSDRLYFDEITFERVADIYEFEHPSHVIVSVGGQTPNNIAKYIHAYGIPILGTKPKDIDRAEDRKKFSALLDRLGIKQPRWDSFTDDKSALAFATAVEYPVLIRPSYVLSGAAMNICYNEYELKFYLKKAVDISRENPVIISKFITNAREIEFDGVAQNGMLKAYVICNHIEHAGVHSGDATIVYPAERVRYFSGKKMIEIAGELSSALAISGPLNIQFMVKDNNVYVIELNLRSSRTFPFISKVTGINFAELAVDAFFCKAKTIDIPYPDYVAVKSPQFSFARLEGADPVLRVEMSSTGEAACFGNTAEEAYLKALMSTGFFLQKKAALITIGGTENKIRFAEPVWRLKNLGFTLYATHNTHAFLKSKGINTKLVSKVYEMKRPNVVDLIEGKKVSLVFNINKPEGEPEQLIKKEKTDGFMIRRAAIDNNIALLTDLNASRLLVNALDKYKVEDLEIKSWDEYI